MKEGHSGFVFIPEGNSEGHGENIIKFEVNAPPVIKVEANESMVN